jgi:predicted Zn-dependent peptidase
MRMQPPREVRQRLENSLTLLTQPMEGVASVAVGLVTRTGSRDEIGEEAGLSHLAEHMLFQGTRRRDTLEISRVINAVGGSLDAYTSRESTAYYAKVPAEHLHLALDVIADMVANARFAPHLLKKEKRVILEEIRMYEDDPEELVHDLFSQALWPQHALGRPIIGSRSELSRVTRTSLVDYVSRHYHPRRLLLSLAGRITPARARAAAERYFGRLPVRSAPGQDGPAAKPATASLHLIQERKLEQVHVCVGVAGLPYADPRRLAAVGLSNIIGGGTNSRLFYEVRERRALVYTIYSFLDFYRDTGVLGIYFACQPRCLQETLRIITVELQRVLSRPIPEREIRDLREQMRGNLLLSLENSNTHMWRMLQHEMYLAEHPSLRATLAAIDRLTAKDIQNLAQALFLKQPLTLAALGPVKSSRLPSLSLK